MIYKNLQTVSDLIQRNEIVKISRNLLFCWYQQIQIHCVQVFKPTLHESTIIFLKFSDVLTTYLLRKQNDRDFSYERYENCWCQQTLFSNFWKNFWWSIYLLLFVALQHVCIKSNDTGCKSLSKKSPTGPIKNGLSTAWRHLSASSFYRHPCS